MEKKTNNFLIIITVLLLVITIIFGAGLCYLSWLLKDKQTSGEVSTENQTTETVVCPEDTMAPTENAAQEQAVSKKGIDVSKYQKDINWAAVAADGVEYAFVRVGCRGWGAKGTLILDEKFGANALGATEHGIKLGAYFFSQAISVAEAEEEARLVVKSLKDYDVTYPVAIDIEKVQGKKARQDKLTKAERTEICIAFCEYIKEAGYTPMVYGDVETFTNLVDVEKLSAYDFWICEIGEKLTAPYEAAVWQYSHKGKVDGIKPEVNLSISYKEW